MKTKTQRRAAPRRDLISSRSARQAVKPSSGRSERKPPPPKPPRPALIKEKMIALALLVPAFAWAFWPTMQELVRTWSREPDYSHGFFVLPVAAFLLWSRRDSYPGLASGFHWPGLLLLSVSCGLQAAAAVYYVSALDGWSLVLWVAGSVWLLGGFQLVRWSWPGVFFLLFAIPLPFRLETMLSGQLQRIATLISTWALQFLGQPALGEGNTIQLGEHQLKVEQACSGLRIFVAIVALAFVYMVAARRNWWEQLLLLLAVVPIALIANATRIVITGLLYNLVSGEVAHRFSHDLAGYVMIPFAALLFALALWYLGKLIHRSDEGLDTTAVG